MADFVSDEWRTVLAAYATELQEHFSCDLSALSGTGIPLEANHRLTLTIEPVGTQDRYSAQSASGGRSTAMEQEAPFGSLLDDDFLSEWLASPDRALIILAPFGAGKSVLLAEFSRRLAAALKAWCNKPVGVLPWVPFPVRLRAWPQGQSLIEYIEETAQKVVDREGEAHLSGQRVRELRQHGRLLPLFDGLDEIPEFAKPDHVTHRGRQESFNSIRRLFPNRHVLTARPGQGTGPVDGPGSKATWHRLQDVRPDEAEKFIRHRLHIPAGVEDHPALQAYTGAQPHINGVFRRPLFLAAWCEQLERGKSPPNTVSQLMDTALRHVLDERLGDWPGGDYAGIRWELERNQHILGAVLAAYADHGFDMTERTGSIEFDPLATTDGDAKKYVQFAESAGLLIRVDNSGFVPKVPVAEYLIGQYYAWLAKKHDTTDPSRHQVALIRAFQRKFWWRDHEDIWLHAFGAMWCGNADQQSMAAWLLSWVLEMSASCIAVGDWDGRLPIGQEESDREPFSCYEFVLEVLPTTGLPGTARDAARALVDKAFEQLKKGKMDAWRSGRDAGVPLEPIARRHPMRLCEWLLESLRGIENRDGRAAIANSIYEVADYLNEEQLQALLGIRCESHDAIGLGVLSSAVGKAAALHGPRQVKMLAELLINPNYSQVKTAVAEALGEASHRDTMAENVLVNVLADARYRSARRELAVAVYFGGQHLPSDRVITLMRLLNDPEYKAQWRWIASAIAKVHLEREQANALIGLLCRSEYKDAWVPLGRCIRNAATVSAEQVHLLMGLLQDPQYKETWGDLAGAIGGSMHMGHEQMSVLLGMLKDDQYVSAWGPMIGAISAHLGPEQMEMFVGMLGNGSYGPAFSEIACAIGNAIRTEPERISMLVALLQDQRYRGAWPELALALPRGSDGIGTEHANTLVKLLRELEHERAWIPLADRVAAAAGNLGREQLDLLVSLLRDPRHNEIWSYLAAAIANTSDHLDRERVHDLISLLSDAQYDTAWPAICSATSRAVHALGMEEKFKEAADTAANAGRISFAIRLNNATGKWLVPFVREVRKTGVDRGIVYGMAERHDPELLLNAVFAPVEIQQLLGVSAPKTALLDLRTKSNGLVLRDKQLEVAFDLARSIHLSPKECAAFDIEWKRVSDATRRRWRRDVLRLMLREMSSEERLMFCSKGGKSGIDALREAEANDRNGGSDRDASKGKQLTINAAMLFDRLLDKSAEEAMRNAHELLLKKSRIDDSLRDYEAPAYICNGCGAVFPIPGEESDEVAPPPKDRCRICKRSLDGRLRDTPSDVLSCPSDENLYFLRHAPTKEGWSYEPRNSKEGCCPCEKCRSRKKLIDPMPSPRPK